MNYLHELNAFRDWTLLNKPTTSEIVLWYALMSINNMTGWKKQFTVANQTLQLMTGLSKATLDRARNKLTQKGLLKYFPGNTRQAGTYELVSIYTTKRDQCETNGETNMRPMRDQCETNGENITKHKQNETKQKDNNTPLNPPKEKPEKIAVSEFVYLTPAEHERLLKEFGEADTSRMIEILDNYIGQNPKKNNRYTDHNRVIRGWVKDRLLEEKARKAKIAQFKPRTNNHREEEPEFDWGYGYKPD